MKRLLLIMMFFSLSASGQVYKFKVYEVAMFPPGSTVRDWEETNVLLALDNMQLKIFARKDETIDLISSAVKEEKDGTILRYVGVDERGIKMQAQMKLYDNMVGEHAGSLALIYTNIVILYRFKHN